jgi:hypothetical protein
MFHVRLPIATAYGNNFVPCSDQVGHQIAADMTRRSDDNDPHPRDAPFRAILPMFFASSPTT